MNTVALAHLLHARRIGRGQWQAKCPAHDDRTPSLSIREGRGGKILIRCWAGCDTGIVLAAAGLDWAALFPAGPPPSLEQVRQAAAIRERKEAEARERRIAHGEACSRISELEKFLTALGRELARHPERGDLAREFHRACDRLHLAQQQEEGLRP
jgi:hypothetical protein